MRVPRPKKVGDHWECDFRPEFSWHTRVGPASLDEIGAIHAAYHRLEELRAARLAEPRAQLELRSGAPRTLAPAVDAWRALKRTRKPASERYIRREAARLVRDLGAEELLSFADGGQALVTRYMDRLVAAGAAPRTVRNALTTLKQVLRFCANPERRWLPFVPEFPQRPSLPSPLYQWVGEAVFRSLRAAVYAPGVERLALESWLGRPQNRAQGPLEHFIARRRIYLSWLFYTGVRKGDADHMTADDIGLDTGIYIRHGRKTDAELRQFPMPEPLVDDLRAYLAIVGREFFLPAEPIGGGRWDNVARFLQRARRQAGITVDVTPMIFRRSFARQMFVLGHEVHEVAEMMGHVDLKMLREIYAHVLQRPPGAARTVWRRGVANAPQSGGAPGALVAFPSAQDLKKKKENT